MQLNLEEAIKLWARSENAHFLAKGLIRTFIRFTKVKDFSEEQRRLANELLDILAPLEPALSRYVEMKKKIKEGFIGMGIENIEIKEK